MKAISVSLFLVFSGTATLAAAAGTEPARSFVQATILGANTAQATVTFLDASGRQRVERTTEAVSVLSALRRGDQAILSLSTAAGGTVVTKVRVHRPEPPAVASADSAATAPAAPAGSFPLRRSWPNPYAKGARPQPDRP
jgi:hypothetical protein